MSGYRQKNTTLHTQVPFVTKDGKLVQVDEGLLGVLEELRRLGVETQYSCQGDAECAYVLGSRKTFGPLLRRIHSYYKKDLFLSLPSRVIAGRFYWGYRSHEFSLFFRKGVYRVLQFTWNRGVKQSPGYQVERLYSNSFGRRVCVRWPVEDTPKVHQMLFELVAA